MFEEATNTHQRNNEDEENDVKDYYHQDDDEEGDLFEGMSKISKKKYKVRKIIKRSFALKTFFYLFKLRY